MKEFEKEMLKDKAVNSFGGGLIISIVAVAAFAAIISLVMTLVFG